MNLLEAARERFKRDVFSSEILGAVIEALDENGAMCSLELSRRHLNGAGEIMGGVIFTLADFTFAVATNYAEDTAVTQTSQITFLSHPKGKRLIATSRKVKSGRNTCFYIVEVRDELGTQVAHVTMTGYRKNPTARLKRE